MNCAGWFLVGVGSGFVVAAMLAGWMWVHLTPGDDHKLSGEEIRERVGEVFR